VDRPQRRLVPHRRARQHLQPPGSGEGKRKWWTVSQLLQRLAAWRKIRQLADELFQLLSGEGDDVPSKPTTTTTATSKAEALARVLTAGVDDNVQVFNDVHVDVLVEKSD